jgi:hypothetical protein
MRLVKIFNRPRLLPAPILLLVIPLMFLNTSANMRIQRNTSNHQLGSDAECLDRSSCYPYTPNGETTPGLAERSELSVSPTIVSAGNLITVSFGNGQRKRLPKTIECIVSAEADSTDLQANVIDSSGNVN